MINKSDTRSDCLAPSKRSSSISKTNKIKCKFIVDFVSNLTTSLTQIVIGGGYEGVAREVTLV